MIVAVLGLSLGAAVSAPVQPVARDTAEPVIVEVALGRIASRTLMAYRIGGTALLPVSQVLSLAEIRQTGGTPRSIEALIEPAGTAFAVDADRHRLTIGRLIRVLDSTEIFARDGEVYLAIRPLGAALGLEWAVNWSDLTVSAIDASGLPVAARINRDWRRRRELELGDIRFVPERLIAGPRRTIDGMVVDYTIYAPSGRPIRDAAYSTAIGLDVVGGSLTATVQNQSGGGRTGLRTDASWSIVRRNDKWLTQLRLGDGIAGGPRPRNLRGVSFGNTPFLRPNQLGEVAFTGDLGPGWQVEAYRGGRMIGFDSVNALGRFSIDAPIAYGENPVDFIAYGPFGEVRRFNRNYRVESNRVPSRHFEYSVAAGACRTDRCRATANADLKYGLSSRWTLGAGVDQFWRPDSVRNLFHPYAALTGSLGNAIGLQAELVANAVARVGVRYEPSTRLILMAEGNRFARGVRAPILTPEGRTSQVTLSGLYRPVEGLGSFYVDGSVDLVRSGQAASSSGRLGASYQWREVQLLPAVRWRRTRNAGIAIAGETTFELSTFLLPIPRLGRFFGQFTARTTIETASRLRPVTLTAYAARNLNRTIRIEAGGGWSRLQGKTLALNVAANLATIRSLTGLTRAGGQTVATQFVQGSVLYNRETNQLRLAAGPSLERAGIAGKVFLDQNGNGRYDQGESPLPNVRVSIGMETRFTDGKGEYHLWNVTPYEPAVIAVDSASLASPLWVPTESAVAVEPTPNRYRIVDIPVAPGGVIDGRVVRGNGAIGVAGIAMSLRNIATGRTRTIVTFSDGDFYSMGIKPGEYELSLESATATRLAITAAPIRFEMPAKADGASISGLILRLP